MFKQKHTVAQALRPLHLLRFQISSHETSLDRRPPRAPRFISAENISIVVTWACFGQLPFFQSSVPRSLQVSAAQIKRYYISIKNQRTSPIKVSSIDLMRAESHDRLSIANGCSRDVVLSHVSAIQKKRRELSILIDTKLPQRYSNPVSKNERLEFFPKKCSFLHVKSSLTSSSMKKREDMQ